MTAPLYDALCAFARQDGLRMHMPGHKGRAMTPLFSAAAIDYTELAPTGNLYTGEGPIAEAEHLAASAFGAAAAYFLTGGSTQGVLAGLALCALPGDTILLDRNTHRSFFSAMALLDLHPVYLNVPDADHVEEILAAHEGIKTVCVTSPTYFGVVADIAAIAAVCRRHGARLLVDEAHGAHFSFVGRGPCAAGRGAAISISSAHKTLPALGGGALLFTDGSFPPALVRERTAMFGTSSPSYPVMASIDWARAYLTGPGGEAYRRTAEAVAALRREINSRGVFHALTEEDGLVLDPTRLTVETSCAGLDGRRAAALLAERWHIWPEMDNCRCVVFILTCCDSEGDIARLAEALRALEEAAGCKGNRPAEALPPAPPEPEQRCSVRAAVFARRRTRTLRDAAGCVSAVSVAPYPPGVPVIAPGERITAEVLDYLARTGYDMAAPVDVLEEGVGTPWPKD